MMRPSSRLSVSDLTRIALFAVLMTLCAWVTVPSAVPFTLQTFALFLSLTCLGGRRGTYAVAVYLLMGAVGLPVFSGFQGGVGTLLGPTGGYLAGLLPAALLYWVMTALLRETRPVMFLACLTGLAACYLFGILWFLRFSDIPSLRYALLYGVLPFLPLDLIKLVLAFILTPQLKHYLK